MRAITAARNSAGPSVCNGCIKRSKGFLDSQSMLGLVGTAWVCHRVTRGSEACGRGVVRLMCGCGAGEMSEEEVRAVIRAEINRACAARPHFERIAGFAILEEPLSVEAGTLTRTLKPRRPAIAAKYARELDDVLSKLR